MHEIETGISLDRLEAIVAGLPTSEQQDGDSSAIGELIPGMS
jgi:hypothetical protein